MRLLHTTDNLYSPKKANPMQFRPVRFSRIDTSLVNLLALGVALVAVPNASASSVVYSCTIPSQSVESDYDCSEPLFDAGPDFVLTGIELTLDTSATVSLGILNSDSVSHNYTLSASVPMTVSGPGPYTVTASPSVGPESGSLGGGDFTEFTDLPASAGPDVVDVLPGDFGLFIGSGSQTFDFDVQAGPIDLSATSDANAPFEIWFTDSATESAVFTVEYDYTTGSDISAAPEPPAATLFIIGSALMGLGLAHRGTLFRIRPRARAR